VNFKQWQRKDAPNLYPEYLRKEIDEFNWWLFNNINNGVYKMQFAQSIGAYNYAFDQFYAGMDEMEARLGNRRFLFGDYVTDSDVRFYTTLARFDTKYYRNLGPLKGRVVDFKNIWGYARDLWEISAFRNNTYFLYFAESSKRGNGSESYSVKFWDKIDYEALWSTPQNRKEMSKTPGQKFLID
jgi:putative glutathione S-transferase